MDYSELDRFIDRLQDAVEDTDPQKGYWRELWALVRQIGDGFKESRYPTLEDKRQARERFNELVARAKARSDQQKAQINERRREWERKEQRSRNTLSRVESKLAAARPTSDFERAIADVILAPLLLVERLLSAILGLEDIDEVRQELLACNEKMREAWGLFREHKDDLLPGDRKKAYDSLTATQKRLNQAWERWKDTKQRVHEQRRRAWQEQQREKEVRRAEREEKHRRFVERVEANIGSLEEKLSRARGALDRHEARLADLRDQYRSAWSDGFRERCSEWIDDCERRIDDIREHIERLEGWLAEERGKLC